MKSPPFSAEQLQATLDSLALTGPYYVAYSGGLDSHVLLHALCSAQSTQVKEIHALYVNHAMNSNADNWGKHCKNICNDLNINFVELKLSESCPKGASREAWAREFRYKILLNELPSDGILLTGHHQDDQAETLLLQVVRGAGSRGLSAMPLMRKREKNWHARPLLKISRNQILEYANDHGLKWIEDDSNRDIDYDRNFFRHEIIPALRKRWPGISKTMARVSAHQAEVSSLLDEIADDDLLQCIGETGGKISIEKITGLSYPRQVNVIRYWIRSQNLPVPGDKKIKQILHSLIPAKPDAIPQVDWGDCEVRRYQQFLYTCQPSTGFNTNTIIDWKLDSPCQLHNGVLSASLKQGSGIRTSICPNRQLQVRYRQGGEKIKIRGKVHNQAVKKLFQENGIPPWLRDEIPLLYVDDVLVAVADMWVDDGACGEENENSWQIEWTAKNDADITGNNTNETKPD